MLPTIFRLQLGAGNISTLSELCDNLAPPSKHLAFYANAALQIADILGIAKKWPLMLNPKSKQSESAWCSATHTPIKRQYRNVLIDILERAYEGGFDTRTLLTSNSGQPTYVRRTVNNAQQLLISNGLLETTDASSGTSIQITDKGRELIQFWIKTEVGDELDIQRAESLRTTILQLHSSNQNQESA